MLSLMRNFVGQGLDLATGDELPAHLHDDVVVGGDRVGGLTMEVPASL